MDILVKLFNFYTFNFHIFKNILYKGTAFNKMPLRPKESMYYVCELTTVVLIRNPFGQTLRRLN